MSALSQFVGGSPVKSVQRGIIYPGFGTSSGTVTISAVNMAKSTANLLGYTSSSTGVEWHRINLSGGSSLAWATSSNSATRYISWEVIEFV